VPNKGCQRLARKQHVGHARLPVDCYYSHLLTRSWRWRSTEGKRFATTRSTDRLQRIDDIYPGEWCHRVIVSSCHRVIVCKDTARPRTRACFSELAVLNTCVLIWLSHRLSLLRDIHPKAPLSPRTWATAASSHAWVRIRRYRSTPGPCGCTDIRSIWTGFFAWLDLKLSTLILIRTSLSY
jgi:hypothetical protein